MARDISNRSKSDLSHSLRKYLTDERMDKLVKLVD